MYIVQYISRKCHNWEENTLLPRLEPITQATTFIADIKSSCELFSSRDTKGMVCEATNLKRLCTISNEYGYEWKALDSNY